MSREVVEQAPVSVYRWLREASGHAARLERADTQESEPGAHEESEP